MTSIEKQIIGLETDYRITVKHLCDLSDNIYNLKLEKYYKKYKKFSTDTLREKLNCFHFYVDVEFRSKFPELSKGYDAAIDAIRKIITERKNIMEKV